jgi:hypothetical protein
MFTYTLHGSNEVFTATSQFDAITKILDTDDASGKVFKNGEVVQEMVCGMTGTTCENGRMYNVLIGKDISLGVQLGKPEWNREESLITRLARVA